MDKKIKILTWVGQVVIGTNDSKSVAPTDTKFGMERLASILDAEGGIRQDIVKSNMPEADNK